jgi:hypothetical protein
MEISMEYEGGKEGGGGGGEEDDDNVEDNVDNGGDIA